MGMYKRQKVGRHIAYVLCCVMVFVQLLAYNPIKVYAAGLDAAVSPAACKTTDLPKRITVTKTGSFTAGGVTPYLLDQSNQLVAATISNVESTVDSVSFTINSGLSNGTYKIRLVDTVNGAYDVSPATFSIGEPSISVLTPSTVPSAYSEQSITVTGQNTNFTFGSTKIEIYAGSTRIQQSTVTSVTNSEQLTFTLAPGIGSGAYTVKAITDSETAIGSIAVAVPSISVNKSQFTAGYSASDITVTGTNTNFNAQTTVVVLDNNTGQATGKAGAPTVANAASLTFKLNTGLAGGSYTIKVSNGETVMGTSALTIVNPSVVLKNSGSAFAGASQGYSASYSLTLEGTNTNFTNDTTLTLYKGAIDDANVITGKISNKSTTSSTAMAFTLGTGLIGDTYYIKAKTSGEEVTASFEIKPISIAGVSLNTAVANNSVTPPKVGKGYKQFQITVTGTNTLFQAATTVQVLDADNADADTSLAGTVTVNSASSLSFNLLEGLSDGVYKIKLDMDGNASTTEDQLTASFNISIPSGLNIAPNNIIKSSSTTPVQYTVTGIDTHFNSGSSKSYAVTLTNGTGDAIETESISAADDNTLIFSIKPSVITADDDPGAYSLNITTTSSAIEETVTMVSAMNMVTSGISPAAMSVNTYTTELGTKEITINGTNTSFSEGTTKVYIDKNKDGDYINGVDIDAGEEIAAITVDSAVKLRFTIPADLSAGSYSLWVDVDGTPYATSINIIERTFSLSSSTVYSNELGTKTIVVTGTATSFDANTKIYIDKNNDGDYMNGSLADSGEEITALTIDSTTRLSFTLPTGLSAGNHDIWAVEGSFSHKKSLSVVPRSVTLSTESAIFEYDNFIMTITGSNVDINTTDKKPAVSIIGNETTNITLSNANINDAGESFIFDFPANLAAGTYTVRASWTGGEYDGMNLDSAFTVNNKYSLIYFKNDGSNVSSITLTQGDGGADNFNLAAWGALLQTGAPDEAITNKANWSVVVGTAVSVNNTDNKGYITINGTGTAVVRAAYDGQTKDITITVNAASTPPINTGNNPPPANTYTSTTQDPTEQENTEETSTVDKNEGNNEDAQTADNVITVELSPVMTEDESKAVVELTQDLIGESIIPSDDAAKTIVAVKIPENTAAVQELVLNAEAVNVLSENKADISISANNVDLKIPVEVIEEHLNSSIQFNIKAVNKEEEEEIISSVPVEAIENLTLKGSIVEITMSASKASGEKKEITSFNKKITIVLNVKDSIDTSSMNTKKLAVYYLDENASEWKYVGGKYNKETGTMDVKTSHFTKFTVMEYNKTFADVAEGYWAKDYIEILAARHITNGVDKYNFNPSGILSRAQFAAYMVRALDLPLTAYEGTFSDVKENEWFAPYVEAAARAGLVAGVGNGMFSPNALITREQMAKMVVEAYMYSTGDSIQAIIADEASDFEDINAASSWAKDYIRAAKKLEIINGMTGTQYEPKLNAQRSQAAKIIITLLETLNEL